MQTFIFQFVVLTKINRLTLKRFEGKYLLLSGFTLEVVQISPANILYSTVFENTYLSFFFQISKKHDFLRFFEMTLKKT